MSQPPMDANGFTSISPNAENNPPAVIHWYEFVNPLEPDASTAEPTKVTCYECKEELGLTQN